mgnify:CR=1 FL=1
MKSKIYINARFLAQEVTGVQRFAIEICRELISHERDVQLIAPKDILDPALANELNVIKIGKFSGHIWEQLELPQFLKKNANALLLNLCNTAPLFYSNKIVTLHDLAFLKHPEWFSFSFRSYYNFLIPRIINKSKLVFTVSESVKDDISKFYHIQKSNITVVYNGLPKIFSSTETCATSFIERPYFLAIGGRNPRKNLKNCILAMGKLGNKDFDLRVISREDKNFSLDKELNPENISVIYETNVSDLRLKYLYQNARALIYPSFYEGFGIPPLEALNLNCPIILSDIEVFRELYKQVAVFCNPSDVDSIKDSINTVIQNNQPRILEEEVLQLNNKYSYMNAAEIMNKQVELFKN